MNNLPRKPVNHIDSNQDLLKSQLGAPAKTIDYSQDQDLAIPTGHIGPHYNVPQGRVLGNHFFRRYLDGTLDIAYARDKVIQAIYAAKDSQQGTVSILTPEQKAILNVCFPLVFSYFDQPIVHQMVTVQFRLTYEEIETIRQAVAASIAEHLNYNGGRGGGSVTGRAITTL